MRQSEIKISVYSATTLMDQHKLKIADVARETGFDRNTITLLYDERAARVDLDTMRKL